MQRRRPLFVGGGGGGGKFEIPAIVVLVVVVGHFETISRHMREIPNPSIVDWDMFQMVMERTDELEDTG
jgi:hypothetical protein